MPIPSCIVIVTAAIRRFHARRDEEGLIGTIRFGCVARSVELDRKRSLVTNRWRVPIDLRYPAPVNGRPVSPSGGISFTFRLTSVSRTLAPAGSGPKAGGGLDAATGYERYASHENKVEMVRSAIYERYLGAFRGAGDRVGDDTGELSRAQLMVSTIGPDRASREAFWTVAWNAARKPSPPRVEIFPGRGTAADWQAIAADPTTPPAVAAIAREVAFGHIREQAFGGDGSPAVPPQPTVVDLVTEEDVAWAEALRNRFGSTRGARMIHYRKPRGGAVQQQLVAELPAECGDAERCAIVAALAADLDRLGLRFTIVVHAPDEHNDRRNWHIHAIWYAGPCTRQPDGSWTFPRGRDGTAKLRPGDIAVALGTLLATDRPTMTHNVLAGADVTALRARYADHVNGQVERLGAGTRYDPRSYAAMGIDRAPAVHLGTAAGRLVATGVTVDVDVENARKSWDAERRRLQRAAGERAARQRGLVARIEASLEQDGIGDARDDAALRDLGRRFEAVADTVAEGRSALDTLDLDRAEAESAARRLLAGTARLIDAIDRGRAGADDLRNATFIRRRHAMAEQHLEEIADAVEPTAEAVAAYREQVAAAERELAELEQRIDVALIERDQRRQDLLWQDATILPRELHPARLTEHRHLDALLDYLGSAKQEEAAERGWARIHLLRVPGAGDEVDVLGLKPLDAEILRRPRFAARVRAALTTIVERQEQAADRLLPFVRNHGLANLQRGVRLGGIAAPEAVLRLYRRFHDHPLVREGLAEADRGFQERWAPVATAVSTAAAIAPCDTRPDDLTGDRPRSASVTPVPANPVLTQSLSRPDRGPHPQGEQSDPVVADRPAEPKRSTGSSPADASASGLSASADPAPIRAEETSPRRNTDHVHTRPADHRPASVPHRPAVRSPERYAGPPRYLSQARSLAGVRRLSDVGLARERPEPALLLHGAPRPDLRAGGAVAAGVRRAGAGDPRTHGGVADQGVAAAETAHVSAGEAPGASSSAPSRTKLSIAREAAQKRQPTASRASDGERTAPNARSDVATAAEDGRTATAAADPGSRPAKQPDQTDAGSSNPGRLTPEPGAPEEQRVVEKIGGAKRPGSAAHSEMAPLAREVALGRQVERDIDLALRSSLYAGLDESSREVVAERIALVAAHIVSGGAVVRFVDEAMRLNVASETMLQDVRALAETEVGWLLLRRIARTSDKMMIERPELGWVTLPPPLPGSGANSAAQALQSGKGRG